MLRGLRSHRTLAANSNGHRPRCCGLQQRAPEQARREFDSLLALCVGAAVAPGGFMDTREIHKRQHTRPSRRKIHTRLLLAVRAISAAN